MKFFLNFALKFCFILISSYLFFNSILEAQPKDFFDELTSERKPIYGSEKEEKYPVRAIIMKVESWQDHFSWDAFFAVSYTNYPQFKEYTVYPFYYYLKDKNSASYRSWSFPLYFSQKVDQGQIKESFNLSLLHYYSYEQNTNYKKETYRFPSFLPLAGAENHEFANGGRNSFRYMLPLLFFRNATESSSWTHFLIFHTGKDQDSDYGALLPLLYWGSGKSKSHLTLLPLFSYDSSKDGTEGMFLSPFYLQTWSENSLLGQPEKKEVTGIPLLLSFKVTAARNGEVVRSNWFTPIFFRGYAKESGTRTNFLYLSGWNTDPNDSLNGAYFFPFLFYEKNSYFTFFPVYFSGASRQGSYWNFLGIAGKGEYGSDKYLYAFPFFVTTESNNESYSLFGPVEFSKNGSSSSFRIYPFYYSGNSPGTSYWNVAGLFGKGEDASDRYAYAFPFFVKTSSPQTSYSLYGPVEFSSVDQNSSFRVYPLYYSGVSSTGSYWNFAGLFGAGKDGVNGYSYAFPFFLRTNSAQSSYDLYGPVEMSSTGPSSTFRIYPLYFSGSSPTGSYWNFAGLAGKGKDGSDTYSYLFPFFLNSDSGTGSYGLYGPVELESNGLEASFRIYPLFYSGKWQIGSYWNFAGIAGSWKEGDVSYSYLFPLFFRNRDAKGSYSLFGPLEIRDSERESSLRVYPIFFSGNSESGSYWNILGLGGRGFDGSGNQRYGYAFPLYYHNKNVFRVFIPFFFRFGYEENDYSSFGIFHYVKRSPELDRTWAVLYFSKEDRVAKESSQFFLPIYYFWDTPKSKASIFLPFYLKYEEEDKSLDLNIAGFSSSKSLSTLQGSSSASIGMTEKELYLDTDFAWFYNLVRVSYRESISKDSILWWKRKQENPLTESKNVPADPLNNKKLPVAPGSTQSPDASEDGLRKYKTLSRDTSKSFFGFSTLFGILSYERGDDRRHFRLLPLAWYSWSEETKDKVTIWLLPPIFKSKIGNQEYNVYFPFYARQDDAADFQEAWMIFGFQRGKKGDTKDYSVLWPFFRTYYSPNTWGFRIFPLVAHDSSPSSDRTISILYYSKKDISPRSEVSSFHSILLPLFHSRETKTSSASGNQEREGYQLFAPFYYRKYDSIEGGAGGNYSSKVLTLLSYYSLFSDISGGSDTSFLFPLYYYNRSKAPGESKDKMTKIDFLIPLGLYYRRNEDLSRFFFLGYYSSSDPGSTYTNVLGLFSSSSVKTQFATFSKTNLFPFYFSDTAESNESVRSNTLIPLLLSSSSYLQKDGSSSTFELLTPIYYRYRESDLSKKDAVRTDVVFPLALYFYKDSVETTRFVLGYYSSKTKDRSYWTLFGLVSSEISSSVTGRRESTSIFPFYFSEVEREKEAIVRNKTMVPILFRYDSKPDSYSLNILLLGNRTKSPSESSFALYPFYSDSESNIAGIKSRTIWGLPFYFERTEQTSGSWDSLSVSPIGIFSTTGKGGDVREEIATSFFLLPFPTLYTSTSEKETSAFWLGFYYNRFASAADAESKEFSFFKLISYNSYKSTNENSTGVSIFPLISFAGQESISEKGKRDSTKNYIFPLFYYNRESKPAGNSFHFNLAVLFDLARDPESGHSRFIFGPIYSITGSNSNSWGIFPLVIRNRRADSSFWFAFGSYSYVDKGMDRWGFAGILDVNRELALQRRNVNVFLGLFHGEYDANRTRWAVLGRLIAGYESGQDYSDANFLWLRLKRSGEESIANFLPAYYYHRDGNEVSTYVPPVLGYFSSGKNGRYDMVGLGLLYYRSESISTGEDAMIVGPGLYYYRARPERGYRSMGILALPGIGGLLWDWEYELQTDYSKYSILQILYSNTTNAGKNYSRIFGIRF
ncbi:hypothetical protein LEP1GSC050_0950 [Leptospira broomii serovar Hurstbridge str. 5399]|uniref:Uncharacterized protein n=1 Tax=Leptospira broomii serovar Hurstbridge str. 5399 TaxID=1049789 RepID=T0FGV4_9LEPT|nr:hypothetical protein [Leptospira broomii]EQA47166.1 hypothetical protein LEP1GSC050_0950 [Leptospira broomii serovar Hurstbridge str. 5399]